MMLRAARLSFAMQRFELRLLLGVAALLVVAALAIAWQIRVARAEELECYRTAPPPVEGSQADVCPELRPRLEVLETGAGVVHAGALVTPFVLGLFLGVPIVAREIEGRTAPIAWTLSRSRRRWLLHRAAPVVAVVVLAALLVGIAGEVLTRAAPWNEGVDPGFNDYGARGGLVAVRALAVLSLGLAMGALVPRQLPALLLAAAVTLALFVGVELVRDDLMRREAVPLTSQEQQQGASQKIYDSALRDDATGELISYDDYYRDHPGAMQGELPPGVTPVEYTVPGSRYGSFVLRESAVLGAVAALALAVTTGVVSRRRP